MRWLRGWSLARGLPRPHFAEVGLVVEVGWPEQVRHYIFVEAGEALQASVARLHGPYTHVKTTVEPAQLRCVLPPGWRLKQPRYLMSGAPGYVRQAATEHRRFGAPRTHSQRPARGE
jgi:hypothetical protein